MELTPTNVTIPLESELAFTTFDANDIYCNFEHCGNNYIEYSLVHEIIFDSVKNWTNMSC